MFSFCRWQVKTMVLINLFTYLFDLYFNFIIVINNTKSSGKSMNEGNNFNNG